MMRSVSRPMGGFTVQTSDVRSSAYHLPADLVEYRPDPAQPIDRWHQRADSANARTCRRIIEDLAGRPTAVIDPFCGAGSSAVAARELGVPFIGVDIDPLLVCVATAKACCDRRHLRLLDRKDADAVEALVTGVHPQNAGSPETFLPACVALTVAASAWSTTAGVRASVVEDTTSGPAPAEGSEIRWGDAGTPGAWAGLERMRPGWVVCGSPPFRSAGPKDAGERALRDAAAGLLRASGRAPRPQPPRVLARPADPAFRIPSDEAPDGTGRAPYTEIVLRVLRQLRQLPTPGLVVLEHEPARPGDAEALSVAREIQRALPASRVKVLHTRRFSAWGPLSLIVWELR
ncbi:hypothetical protein [Streptomyces sp. NPDC054804]